MLILRKDRGPSPLVKSGWFFLWVNPPKQLRIGHNFKIFPLPLTFFICFLCKDLDEKYTLISFSLAPFQVVSIPKGLISWEKSCFSVSLYAGSPHFYFFLRNVVAYIWLIALAIIFASIRIWVWSQGTTPHIMTEPPPLSLLLKFLKSQLFVLPLANLYRSRKTWIDTVKMASEKEELRLSLVADVHT